jgi:hypothetical protein
MSPTRSRSSYSVPLGEKGTEMRRVLVVLVVVVVFCMGMVALSAGSASAQSFQRTPGSGAAGTVITVSAAECDQPLAGAGLVGNPGGVVPVQAETAPAADGTWSVQLVLPAGIDPDLDYVVVARCGNPDAGGFFYSPDLPFDVLRTGGRVVTVPPPFTG